jgi:hypothetical protein
MCGALATDIWDDEEIYLASKRDHALYTLSKPERQISRAYLTIPNGLTTSAINQLHDTKPYLNSRYVFIWSRNFLLPWKKQVHRSEALDSVLYHLNPLHIFRVYLYLVLSPTYVCPDLASNHFPQGLCAFLASQVHATCEIRGSRSSDYEKFYIFGNNAA